jgi:quercetin dioxygenase-like cupin family protein
LSQHASLEILRSGRDSKARFISPRALRYGSGCDATRQRAAQPTIGGSVYVKPQEIAWEPTQFDGISIKVLYEDQAKGEMTCLLKWEPGAALPMHKHPEIEQTYVVEGSFYDQDGICRAGEFVWRRVGSFHETHSDEGAVILAVYRKPNVFQHSTGYARDSTQ